MGRVDNNGATPVGDVSQTMITVASTPAQVMTTNKGLNETMRIVGGFEADIRDFPYQAYVRVFVDEEQFFTCGACIIAKQWILTASHCLRINGSDPKIEMVSVGVGSNRNTDKFLPISAYHIHPKYVHSGEESYRSFDVALIQLRDPLKYSQNVQRARLPKPDEVDEYVGKKEKAWASGYGLARWNDTSNVILRAVAVTIWSRKECETAWKGHSSERMFCAGYREGGKDSCRGDSGGPLVVRKEDSPVLLGLVAGGNFKCGSPDTPGEYTRVSYYTSWICSIIGCRYK